jgi:hypothetical protein
LALVFRARPSPVVWLPFASAFSKAAIKFARGFSTDSDAKFFGNSAATYFPTADSFRAVPFDATELRRREGTTLLTKLPTMVAVLSASPVVGHPPLASAFEKASPKLDSAFVVQAESKVRPFFAA